MRFAALSIGSLALVAIILPFHAEARSVAEAGAELRAAALHDASSAAFPYFRRGTGAIVEPQVKPTPVNTVSGWASATAPAPAAVVYNEYSTHPKVGMALEPDRDEAFPGDEVVYCICVQNMYQETLGKFDVAFFYDPNLMTIVDAAGGRMEGNHIRFTVPPLKSGEKFTRHIRVRLPKNLRAGAVLRTYASLVWDGTIDKACAKHDLTIIHPPKTGFDLASLSTAEATLRPIAETASTNGLSGLLAMGSVAISGTGIGVGIGRKKFGL